MYEYFVSFSFDGNFGMPRGEGNTTISFDHPIRESHHIREIEKAILDSGSGHTGVVLNNFILLNKEVPRSRNYP